MNAPCILTSNFYSDTDTIVSGVSGFSGISDSTIESSFQIFVAEGYRTTDSGSTNCFDYFYSANPIYVRFRFISDSVADSLAGWIIDSMQIEEDQYPGRVVNVNKNKPLNVFQIPLARAFTPFQH